VSEGHGIAHKVESAILENMPQVEEVLVYVEPEEELSRKKATSS
jgi:divalent metal cation (Fe/Co/Zn/Cd) transporter